MNIKRLKKIEKPLRNIFAAIGFGSVWCTLFVLAYSFVPRYNIFGEKLPHFFIDPTQGRRFVSAVIFAPLIEEIIFRVLPIQILNKTGTLKTMGLPVILGTSAIFGFIHGSNYNSFIQGVMGLLLCWVYIKNGFSYWSAVTVHAIYNFMVLFALPFIYNQ